VIRRLTLLLISAAPLATLAGQDGIMFTAGYVLAGEPDQSSWRLTMQRNLAGPIGLDIGAQVLPGSRPADGDLYGFEVDFTLLEGARRFPALFFGAAAGIGVQDQDRVFYGVSAGLRFPVVALGAMRMTLEGRWRTLSVDDRDGLELGATIGWRRPRGSATSRPDATGLYVPRGTTERLRAAGIPEEKARLIGSVVSTAIEEMGQPYVWGGTGDGSGGFDCSGLIYYAYGRYNVRIPRTSAGQATAGIAIRRETDALLPGDILTFAESGSQVTHVGLYVGEDRFIHSASGGVRLSRLAEDDPYGRYWLRRWVGVRRVVE
jgi:cell wall-associated NlpC family hydrolase